jgi:glycosyltransferase involved in cell wall biosynthesis
MKKETKDSLEKVTVIIPAYNEAKRILNVIIPALKCKLVKEVIVIDDCSKDNTSEVVRSVKDKRLRLIRHKKNTGKTLALKDGIDNAKTKYILFLDADLLNVNPRDLERLIIPVTSKRIDVSLSIRKNSLWIYKLTGCDFISGERCLPKDFMSDLWIKPNIGFGIEVLMNRKILRKKMRFASIHCSFSNTMKKDKEGFFKGIKSEFKMLGQINKALPLPIVIGQYFKMSCLSKRYRRLLRS